MKLQDVKEKLNSICVSVMPIGVGSEESETYRCVRELLTACKALSNVKEDIQKKELVGVSGYPNLEAEILYEIFGEDNEKYSVKKEEFDLSVVDVRDVLQYVNDSGECVVVKYSDELKGVLIGEESFKKITSILKEALKSL